MLGRDLKMIERTGYTILDALSDIGGLSGMLVSLIGLFVNIWNHNYLQNYMVARLFTQSDKKPFLTRVFQTKHHGIVLAREALLKEIDVIKLIRSLRYYKLAIRKLID